MKKSICLLLLTCFLTPVLSFPALAGAYILAPNDQLEIKVINHKDFDTKQAIAPDAVKPPSFWTKIVPEK